MKRRRKSLATFAAVTLCSSALFAETLSAENKKLYELGLSALHRGAPAEAIGHFELLADRGATHPDLSFNRAAAYLARAHGANRRPGDMGHAAAALEETLVLRPSDDEAKRSLADIRAEILRQRSKNGKTPIVPSPSLGRTLTSLLSETALGLARAFGLIGNQHRVGGARQR